MSQMISCPVCAEPTASTRGQTATLDFYSCPDCGDYSLEKAADLRASLQALSGDARAALRRLIRWHHEHGPSFVLDSASVRQAILQPAPGARVRAQRLLEDLCRVAADAPFATLEYNLHRYVLFWLGSAAEMTNVLDAFADSGIVRVIHKHPDAYSLHLTPRAWALKESGFDYQRSPEI